MHTKSITKKLIVSIVLFSSSITFILTGIQLYGDYKNEVSTLSNTINDVEAGLIGVISSNVWLDDKEELNITLNGINTLPAISFVAIYVDSDIYVSRGTKKSEGIVSKSIPIEYIYNNSPHIIGSLYIEANLEDVYQRMTNRFWVILASNTLKTFIVSIFIFILVENIIIKKLHDISLFINNHDIDNFKKTIQYIKNKHPPYDEIDDIASAINNKQRKLEDYFNRNKESETHIRLLLNSTGEGICGFDTNGNITFANDTCIKTLEYDNEKELLGKNIHRIIHHSNPICIDATESKCPLHIENITVTTTHTGSEYLSRKNGTQFPVDYTISPIVNEGIIMGTVITFKDISERKQYESLIRDAQQRIIMHVQRTPLGVIEWDINFCVTEWNASAERIFGFTKDEALGHHASAIIIPDKDNKNVGSIWNQLLTSKAGIQETNENITKTGQHILCDWYITPLINEAGNTIGFASLVQDITKQKMAETALIKARDEAEFANQAKSEFLSSMSHELRTPMNAILGFSQLLEMDDTLSDGSKGFVEEIITGGNHLMTLINDLLDLSKIEAGKLECALENCSLSEILTESISFIEPIAASNDIQLINKISTISDYTIHVNHTRFKQVILNLLSNAIKYNNKNGTVILTSELIDDNQLRIIVSDTGNGLTEEEIKSLFKPFERIGRYSGIDGVGIGLVISKRLINLMGGTIGVESEPGKGSSFWLQIPLQTKTVNNSTKKIVSIPS